MLVQVDLQVYLPCISCEQLPLGMEPEQSKVLHVVLLAVVLPVRDLTPENDINTPFVLSAKAQKLVSSTGKTEAEKVCLYGNFYYSSLKKNRDSEMAFSSWKERTTTLGERRDLDQSWKEWQPEGKQSGVK